MFNTDLLEALELGFLLDIAEVTVVAAINRRESRGGHFREDFPTRDDVNYMKHTMIYRRPLDDQPGQSAEVFEGSDEYFSHVEAFDDYKVVLGSKPVTVTRYQPMERKY
jgi:succinate dehydrogenase / fumarate reductase flavoprotein subunit